MTFPRPPTSIVAALCIQAPALRPPTEIGIGTEIVNGTERLWTLMRTGAELAVTVGPGLRQELDTGRGHARARPRINTSARSQNATATLTSNSSDGGRERQAVISQWSATGRALGPVTGRRDAMLMVFEVRLLWFHREPLYIQRRKFDVISISTTTWSYLVLWI